MDGPDGLTVVDADTGEDIVTIPHDAVDEAWRLSTVLSPVDPPVPDWSVLATADGETWLHADIDEGEGSQAMAPPVVATDGDVTIVGAAWWEPPLTQWYRFEMPD